ncbi:MAG: hypothetical protein ACE5HC_06505 [Candidatus Binatia bacterium]
MMLNRRLTVEKKELLPEHVRASAAVALASFSPVVKIITNNWRRRGLFLFLEMVVVKIVFLLFIASASAAPKA